MKKSIAVALGVCIICSLLVSTAAVSLNSIQEENRTLDRIRNILVAAGLPSGDEDMQAIFEDRVRPVIIDLSTGAVLPEEDYNDILNVDSFNVLDMAGDAAYGMEVPVDRDMAGIRRMPRYMLIYFIRENGKTSRIVLPVYGKGLWSTMFGFIALESDLRTVRGFTVYEHAETPGLGGEVDNPAWKRSWRGKQALDEAGNVLLRVIKGRVDDSRPESRHLIDGLSGATLTSRGVDRLVRFWLGENGYGPFLKRLKEEQHGQV